MSDQNELSPNDVAVIGMAGRFPGAADLRELWRRLELGEELLSHFPAEELETSSLVPDALRQHPDFVRSAGVLEDAESFDHDFFGVSPREAAWMDPQQRVFLECAWSALEDAAYDPARFAGKISLYAGAGASGHLLKLLAHAGKDPASLFEALGTTTGENLATKASFKLGLRGESLSVYTACSTGLVAVHLACQSLLMRQSDLALAGAVKINTPQKTGYLFQEGMIFSPDGHCRAFDASARGTVSGHGAGVVVLKLLEDAVRDGDHVYAVIKGSAINNDGARKVGFTAPSVEGQSAVISEALAYAGVSADQVGYVEAHGTGTPLGDPIELAALTRAYRQDSQRKGYCALGSVKTNLGHLDTAAGIAGLIKTALTLHHGVIAPSLHFSQPNPALRLEESPFAVATSRREWSRAQTPRYAAVSSFGIGGTNAHAVLGEAPLRAERGAGPRPVEVVTLSARTPAALARQADALASALEADPSLRLEDVAFTRNLGRRAFEHRRALVAKDRPQLLEVLRGRSRTVPALTARELHSPEVVFLIPGQGSQAAGMARTLAETEPLFGQALEEASMAVLRWAPSLDVRALLAQSAALHEPRLGLPALFAVEYALARTWIGLGVTPGAFFGHSYGEYVAAHLAGVLSLEDAARLAVARGELMSRMPPGRMLAVALGVSQLSGMLESDCSVAAINGEERTVVAGPVESIARLAQRLGEQKVAAMELPTRFAFHSAAVEPLREGLLEVVHAITLSPPTRPLISSLTGTWATAEELTRPEYWARQMREPVRFLDGLKTLLAQGHTRFLEVGPDQGLTSLVRAHLTEHPELQGVAIPSLPRNGSSTSEAQSFAAAIGALWERGVPFDWSAWYGAEERRRVSLPTYPFERNLCRLESKALSLESVAAPTVVAPAVVAPAATPVVVPDDESIEAAVIGIWRERLGAIEIGLEDNFLELGGNSLMAAQMLTRLRERFAVQLPLSDLFEAPTVAGLSERIRALLANSLPGKDRPVVPPLLALPRDQALPFSVVQERVWWLEKLSPGNPALNMTLALRLRGTLEVELLRQALDRIVARHEALRTVYPESPTPLFQVLPSLRVELPILAAMDETEALRLAREEAATPFRLHQDPVIRARLVRQAATHHLLLVTVHHLVSDTWSMVALARELLTNYQALLKGQPSPLPPLSHQYADYAHWQHRCLSEGAFSDQETYWRSRLVALPPPLPLPTDRPRLPTAELRSTRRLFQLPSTLATRVNALAQARGVTPFMVLLAGFKAVLARYSGTTDVVVGTPIGNRSRGELEPLIGYVAHALPLRTDLSGDPTFQGLLERVKETTLGAYAHADLPYEHFAREVEPDKDLRRARPFDALFILHAGFESRLSVPGLELELVNVPDAPAQFGATLSELSISMGEGPHGYEGTLEYAHALFDASTIDGLLGHWEQLLTAACEDPSLRLGSLPLLTASEHREAAKRVRTVNTRALDFSLSFFANDEDSLGADKYRLFLEGARFADAHGFAAVWTPERHFHSFGGLYPSPALSSAALATITRKVQLRAGSVVLPLHDPLEVAEQWSVVDNLTGGRVGVSFASGWHAQDFVLAPNSYRDRKERMLREIDTVRRLWRGEAVERTDGNGQKIQVRIRPRPVQPQLPFWLTAAGSPDTFRLAGEMGANVLTNLMGQKLDGLQEKIALYRESFQRDGHGPGRGQVTLMLHAFLGADAETARAEVRAPLLRYFRSSVDIFQSFAKAQGLELDPDRLTEQDLQALTAHGLERYLQDGGLFGTVETALPVVERVRGLDVDEVACLIDFGAPVAATLDSLKHLAALRERLLPAAVPDAPAAIPSLEPARQLRERQLQTVPPGLETWVVDDRLRPVPTGVPGELVVAGPGIDRDVDASALAPHPLVPGAVIYRTARRARLERDGQVRLLADAPAPAARLQPVPRGADLPLSFAQQRLWYMDQLEPGNIAYNNPSALRMVGQLDADALGRCLAEVIRRHEILRTTFHLTPSGPVQRIAAALELPVHAVELDGADVETRRSQVAAYARTEAAEPFDLAQGPLVRATLLQVASDEHVLLLTMHHIVSDGWSAGVLAQELAVLYRAFSAGQPSPLPALQIQYADYAVWQRQWMQGPQLERELGYWKTTLAELPVLQLPVDRPRPAVQTYRGDRVPVSIPRQTVDALAAAGRQVGATPFMVVMAAYQALLSRYSGQTDFAVGTPVAGRNRPEVEPLVGCFVNTLVLRGDLSGDPTFLELVRRTRTRAIAAFAHQEAPFEKLVDALHLPRELSHTPLVQAMLVLHNTPNPEVRLSGLTLSGMELHNGATKLDLTLELREGKDGLQGGLEFNTDLFDRRTAEQLARHLVRLLESVAGDPELSLSRLPLLDAADRTQLARLGQNDQPPKALEASTVHQLFEHRVDRAPDAPALVQERGQLSYAQLEARANQIAHALLALRLPSGSRVVVALEDPAEVIAGMLGALKAGAAYVPVDPLHPEARLGRLLEVCAPGAVITRGWLASRFQGHSTVAVDGPQVTAAPQTRPGSAVTGSDAAYVLFTSGSTGEPKGVVVEHRQLLASTAARLALYPPVGLALVLSPFTFDAATGGIFWSLLSGGALAYPDDATRDEPARLAAFIGERGITQVMGVPALYAQILGAARSAQLRSLRAVLVGGEACPPELVASHSQAAPGVPLFNEYGPTEATVWATCQRAEPGTGTVPIGRPIPGVQVLVLDAQRRLVPQGAPGELYLAGATVARGYLQGETDRFLEAGAESDLTVRAYRTGDLARWRTDGALEFLGRADGQVKLRGFRIELGEIETALASHPSIREVAVHVAGGAGRSRRLVAYLACKEPLSAETLRAYLRPRLPEYMVPSAFLFLEVLPRTSNSKVDLRALAALEVTPVSGNRVAPTNERERALVEIWKQVLGLPEVGIHDNFFELGGDSILSIQIVTRAAAAGLELSPKQVFQNPTVAQLALVANTRLAVQAEQEELSGPVALTPIQRWFFQLELAQPAHWNMSVTLELGEPLDPVALQGALDAVARHHDALRLRFQRTAEGWTQQLAPWEGSVPLHRIDLGPGAAQEAEATRLQASLPLEGGPLFAAAWFDTGPGRPQQLILLAHHLVVDGVSWRFLLEDLATAYTQLRRGEQVSLPAKTSSLRAWSSRLLEDVRANEAERGFWTGLPWSKTSRLPRDQQEAVATEGGARQRLDVLTPAETQALLQDVHKAYSASAHEALLTALAQTLARWSGASAALIDVETHGREELFADLDVSRTVGWFTSIHPAVLEVPATGPGPLLQSVKEQLRAVPRHGLGFLPLHTAGGLASLPQAEVSFNYLGQLQRSAQAGWSVSSTPLGVLRGHANRRPYLLDFSAAVLDGSLEVRWSWPSEVHQQRTVDAIAADFLLNLRTLLDHCQSPTAGGHSPSDFPLAKMDQARLDKLAAKFGKKSR